MENFSLLWNSEIIFKWKYKIHLIFGFCFHIMSFCDLSKLLAIALTSSISYPNILEQIVCPFHTQISAFIHVPKVATKISWPRCAFCWTHHQILWKKSMIVSVSYPYMMHLYVFISFIYVTYHSSKLFSLEVSDAYLLTLCMYSKWSNMYMICLMRLWKLVTTKDHFWPLTLQPR